MPEAWSAAQLPGDISGQVHPPLTNPASHSSASSATSYGLRNVLGVFPARNTTTDASDIDRNGILFSCSSSISPLNDYTDSRAEHRSRGSCNLLHALLSSKIVHCSFIFLALIALWHIFNDPPKSNIYLSAPISPSHSFFISQSSVNEDCVLVRKMTMHAWDGYINHAKLSEPSSNGFEYHDNLDPISCIGVDELGDLAVTLIDGADTLATNGLLPRFRAAVDTISQITDFSFDRYVSFFEIGIRILGGLISVHLQAVDKLGSSYDGKILTLAVDIGDRLYASFSTHTGIPYSRVNLKTGDRTGPVISIAEVGSCILEFGYLSKLTGNPKYYKAAKRALIAVFKKRSRIGLYGQSIDASSGLPLSDSSHISGGIDSFFEYLIKGYFVFHDDDLYIIFMEAYRAVQYHLEMGGVHTTVSRTTGSFHVAQVEALEMFWPGVQVLIGDFEPAIRKILLAGQVMTQHNFVPESSDATHLRIGNPEAAQRPELAESLYYMIQAFSDPGLRAMSKRIRDKTEQITKAQCGYAVMRNADDANSQKHQQFSFVIAELFKYLYLTADDGNPINKLNDDAYIMTTEAHPYKILVKTQKQKFQKSFDLAAELGISSSELEARYGMKTRVCSYAVWLRASLRLAFAPVSTGFKWMNANFPIILD